MTNVQKKTLQRDRNFEKLALIFQTLFNEEIIKKNTFDKMYEFLKSMEQSQADYQDFLLDFVDSLNKVPVPAIAKTTTSAEYMLQGNITVRGKSYSVTIKEI